jgi:hypothetical protein
VSNIAPDDVNSVFSATPPLEAIRAQCSLMMSLQPLDGEPIVMQFLDISKAHPHCPMLRQNVYVRLPKEFGISAGMCALLIMCLYGLRDAPKAFEFRLREAFIAAGYKPGVFSACCYCLEKYRVTYVIHGDDFVGVGPKKHLKAFVAHLRTYFTVKEMAYLGPGCKDKEAKILNRIITYVDRRG